MSFLKNFHENFHKSFCKSFFLYNLIQSFVKLVNICRRLNLSSSLAMDWSICKNTWALYLIYIPEKIWSFFRQKSSKMLNFFSNSHNADASTGLS